MELPVLNREGKKISSIPIGFAKNPHSHLLYRAVTNTQKRKRQGTAQAKEKGEITASTRKIMPQKGKGRARKGSAKSNILRSGGRAFPPKSRQYGGKINKKEKKKAQQTALAYKVQKEQVTIIQDFAFKTPKTKEYLGVLKKLSIPQNEKIYWVIPEIDQKFILASRNVSNHTVRTPQQINAYELTNANRIILFEKALTTLEEKYR